MKKYILLKISFVVLFGGMILTACQKDSTLVGGSASTLPKADSIKPGAAASNTTLTLTGSGIGAIRIIVFDSGKVVASFNPNFNTDQALLFRVPTDAIPGKQNIIFTNSLGVSFTVPFNVLGFPVIQDVSNYDFGSGTSETYTLTLTGKNLADVTKVVFSGTTTNVTIVSKSLTSLVITMPTTTLTRTKLDITNTAGTITTTQEFVNVDLAYPIFTDNYATGFQNNSWGPASISTTVAKSGTASFMAGYNKGNWSADGFANWSGGIASDPNYKYLTFWVKGAANSYTYYLTGDKKGTASYGNNDRSTPLVIPANVWTYFKLDISTIDLWHQGSSFQQLGWWIPGPNDQDATLYFDDVLLVK